MRKNRKLWILTQILWKLFIWTKHKKNQVNRNHQQKYGGTAGDVTHPRAEQVVDCSGKQVADGGGTNIDKGIDAHNPAAEAVVHIELHGGVGVGVEGDKKEPGYSKGQTGEKITAGKADQRQKDPDDNRDDV